MEENIKKKYEAPEVSIAFLHIEDIIVTSPGSDPFEGLEDDF